MQMTCTSANWLGVELNSQPLDIQRSGHAVDRDIARNGSMYLMTAQ